MGGAKGVEVRPNSIRLTFLPGKPTLMAEGVPIRPTASNIARANKLAAEIRERMKWGTFSMAEYFPANGIAGAVTVGDQLDTWLGAQRIKTSTKVGYQTAVRFWKAEIGDKPLRGLKRSDVLVALANHPDLAGKTVNNRTSVLKSALDLAVQDKMLPANPMAGLARAKQQKAPIEPFSADESARILAGVEKRYPGALANMIEFWFRTGLRTSELFGLKWSSIDMVAGTALIHEARVTGVEESTTKTGKTREVRLDARALAALQRQKALTFMAGAHVFVDPFTSKPWQNTQAFSRRVWVPLLKAVSVTYRRPYNIRHTRATEMLMAGLNPAFSARQLGHDVNVYLTVYAKWISGANDAAEMAKLERTGT
jgi:integrase